MLAVVEAPVGGRMLVGRMGADDCDLALWWTVSFE
jgi:hypothetical protein